MSNFKIFSQELMDKFEVESKRKAFLFNVATGESTENERLSYDYIKELQGRIDKLEREIRGGK